MGDDKWERVIATKRTAFFPTKTLCAGKKYNNEEACKTAAIVNALYRLYERNGLSSTNGRWESLLHTDIK